MSRWWPRDQQRKIRQAQKDQAALVAAKLLNYKLGPDRCENCKTLLRPSTFFAVNGSRYCDECFPF